MLAAGRDSVRASFLVPPEPTGWVVIGREQGVASPITLDRTLNRLALSRLATVVLDLPDGDARTLAGWVQVAASELRDDLARSLPLAYLGGRETAAPGWIASVGGSLDGVMTWNARPFAAWPYLRSVTVPSLMVVDSSSALLYAHAARWQLGARPEIVSTGSFDAGVLTAWYRDRLLWPDRPRATGSKRRVASLGLAAALAGGPAGTLVATAASRPAAAATVALPDFSTGNRLVAAQIGGDSARALAGPRAADAGSNTLRLTAAGIEGDGPKGPMGDPPLVDGIGLRWNVNTNVGFTTSSSASGAVSEAGFTHPVAASTLNGGTVNAQLADAFDGYNALCVDLNNVGGQCNTANMAVYNQNGPASLECSGRQVVLPFRAMGNFQVRRKVFVPSNDGFARWLNIFRNTSASPQTVRMQTSNNLGSDAGTRIVTTSDGDATPELTDQWVTTFSNFSGTISPDPRLGHVLQGPSPPVGLAAINFANGDDNPFWRYVFTLGPGETAIIMNFATGQATRAAAAAQSASLASLTNPNALTCMTAAERGQVRNFASAPTITTQASPGGPVGTSLTDTATLSGGFNPTGTVTFRLFSDAACTNQVFTSTNALVGASATSGSFVPAAPGTYFWTAEYSGDPNNPAVTSGCGAPNESAAIVRASPTITTQASPGGPLGTALTDTATVSGGFNLTGSVTFRLFTNSTCTTQVFTSTNSLAGGTATSGSFTPTAPGTYYWTAVYNGDANNNTATSGCNAPNESAAIVRASPTITTQASPGGPLGTALTDTATVSGGFNLTGSVTFRLFTNSTCTTQVFTSTNSLAGGTATSGSFTPTAPGTYYWTAVYNGDANNNTATSGCNAPNESAAIVRASPTITTQASPGGPLGTALTDTATVSGGFNLTGSVTFRLFTNSTCTTQVFTSTNSLVGGTATSGSFTPTAPGTYYWTAVYNGDANNNTATSGCNAPNESATIAKASPTISTQASAGGPVGTALTDTATIAGGASPTGSATFRLFSNSTCTTQVFTSTNNVVGGTATSGSFTPTAPGTYYWTAVYNGDANNNTATSGCNAPNESATIAKASPTISTQASPGGLQGTAVTDTATISGGFSPTGTVTFRLFSDATCTTQVFASTNAVSAGTATSGNFTPAAPGTYRWTAVYSGDASNNAATSSCNAPNESVTITPFSPPAPTQTLTGDVAGPVVVNAGQSVLVTNSRVAGGIIVNPGGALTIVNSQISGGIVVDNPSFLSICGANIAAPSSNPSAALVVRNATVPIRIGDPAAGCAGNRFAGGVQLTGNTGGLTFGGNIASQNVTVTNNTGPNTIVIKANNVSGTLACSGNSPPPTNAGQPNTAATKTGQCAGL